MNGWFNMQPTVYDILSNEWNTQFQRDAVGHNEFIDAVLLSAFINSAKVDQIMHGWYNIIY